MRIHYINVERLLCSPSLCRKKCGIGESAAIIIAGAVAAGASTASTIAASNAGSAASEETMGWQSNENQIARDYNSQQAIYAREHQTNERLAQQQFAVDMMNQANQYNSPINQLALRRDAGLSPVDMSGQSYQSVTPPQGAQGNAGATASTSPANVMSLGQSLMNLKSSQIKAIGDKVTDIAQSFPMINEQLKSAKEDAKAKKLDNEQKSLDLKYERGKLSAYEFMLRNPYKIISRYDDDGVMKDMRYDWEPHLPVADLYGKPNFNPSDWLTDKLEPVSDEYLKDSANRLYPKDYDPRAWEDAKGTFLDMLNKGSKTIADISFNEFNSFINSSKMKELQKKGSPLYEALSGGIEVQTFNKLKSEALKLSSDAEFWNNAEVKEGRVSMFKDSVKISEITRQFREDTNLHSLVEKIKDPNMSFEDKVISLVVGFGALAFAAK